MKRIIIFTGKGGVGKTSVAAAHARRASLEGKKTLLVSTDMAHNLSDLFDCSLGKVESKINNNLYALEIDPNYEMSHDFQAMMNAFNNIFPVRGENIVSWDDIKMFPGIEELFSLLKIQTLYENSDYDLIIVDCAPTGETLSLLKFPELLSWYMEKLFPLGKVAMKVMRPVSRLLYKIQLPDGKAMNDMEKLYIKLAGLQELLRNRDICSVRLVTIPEKMVVEETKRNYMYLNLYNFNVDGLYINRVLPDGIDNSFFDEWMQIQKYFMEELYHVFLNIPIYHIKWYNIDLNGLEALDRVCQDSLTDENLFDIKQTIQNETYKKTEDGYLLTLYLPCISKEEVSMHQTDKELVIKIGNFKRNIPLPNVLRQYTVQTAKFNENTLEIDFRKEIADE